MNLNNGLRYRVLAVARTFWREAAATASGVSTAGSDLIVCSGRHWWPLSAFETVARGRSTFNLDTPLGWRSMLNN